MTLQIKSNGRTNLYTSMYEKQLLSPDWTIEISEVVLPKKQEEKDTPPISPTVKSFHVHKFALIASSNYFSTLLGNQSFSEHDESTTKLELTDFECIVFERIIIPFMYYRTIEISEDDFACCYVLSQFLQMTDLMKYLSQAQPQIGYEYQFPYLFSLIHGHPTLCLDSASVDLLSSYIISTDTTIDLNSLPYFLFHSVMGKITLDSNSVFGKVKDYIDKNRESLSEEQRVDLLCGIKVTKLSESVLPQFLSLENFHKDTLKGFLLEFAKDKALNNTIQRKRVYY